MRIQVPIVGPLAKDTDVEVNNQRSINLYPEVELVGAKSQITLKSTPGLLYQVTAGNGPIRSNFVEWSDKTYFVSGQELMSMDAGLAVTSIGTLTSSSGRCHLAAGRNYLAVVDGRDLYTWDGADFATVTDSGDPDYDADCPTNPEYIVVMDGYFIVNNQNSDQFNISTADDPQAWDALDFATADKHPDDLKALATEGPNLYLIGEKTTEVWWNSGNADFPFERYANGVIEWGIAAPHSLAQSAGSLFMLGTNRQGARSVVMVNGFQASPISDPDMDDELATLDTVSDAIGMSYHQSGKTFYFLTFPTEDRTFVYHVEQQMWHERKGYEIGRHRAAGMGAFADKTWVGDYVDGKIYTFEPDVYTDNGATIERKRTTQVLHKDRQQISVNRLEIEFAPGVGVTTGQGSDPQVMLRYSVNGGRTWSSEQWRDIGALGDFHVRCVWEKFGQAPQFTFEITVTDPVRVTIVGGYADVEA